MQGHKQFPDRVVLRFRLSERVPKQNLYRRLMFGKYVMSPTQTWLGRWVRAGPATGQGRRARWGRNWSCGAQTSAVVAPASQRSPGLGECASGLHSSRAHFLCLVLCRRSGSAAWLCCRSWFRQRSSTPPDSLARPSCRSERQRCPGGHPAHTVSLSGRWSPEASSLRRW
jgi:hypothetical protein